MEYFGLEETFKVYLIPIPSQSKGHFDLYRFAPSPAQPGTEHLKSSKKSLKNFVKVQGPHMC